MNDYFFTFYILLTDMFENNELEVLAVGMYQSYQLSSLQMI